MSAAVAALNDLILICHAIAYVCLLNDSCLLLIQLLLKC